MHGEFFLQLHHDEQAEGYGHDSGHHGPLPRYRKLPLSVCLHYQHLPEMLEQGHIDAWASVVVRGVQGVEAV
jgi:hypothetical protein